MKRRNYSAAVFSGSATLLLLLAQISGCSDGENDAPSNQPPVVTGGASGSGGSGKGGGSSKGGNGAGAESNGGENSGGSGNDSSSGGTGNTGTAGDGAGGSPPDNGCEPELTGDDCWTCPEEPEQYLNQCTNAQCSPFVNDKAHLPLLNDDGTLPDLP